MITTMRQKFLIPSILMAIFTGSVLFAEESQERVLRIHSVDTGDFPVVSVTTSIRPPYPQFTISEDPTAAGTTFNISERIKGEYTSLNPISITPEAGRADAVNLVFVLDYTQSIDPVDFENLKNDARYLVASLRDTDLAAIYAFNHSPELKSEFISDRDQLANVINSLKRIGKKTRVFDALYSGIYSARGARGIRVGENGVVQSAVVILTDGRDEGSVIKEEDLHEILRIGTSYRIPVFTVLYGKSENIDVFRRLSIKTGGLVLKRNEVKSVDSLVDMIRRIPARTYRIKFRSSIRLSDFVHPWSNAMVRVRLSGIEGPGSDEVSYRVPFFSLLVYDIGSGRSVSVTVVAVFLMFIGFLVLLWLLRRKPSGSQARIRRKEKKGKLVGAEEGAVQYDTAYEREHRRWEEESIGEGFEQGNGSVPEDSGATATSLSKEIDSEEFEKFEADEERAHMMKKQSEHAVKKIRSPYKAAMENELLEEADGGDKRAFHDPFDEFDESNLFSTSEIEMSTGITLTEEGERRVYMREYVYHLLQLALRGADRYEDASLLLESARDNFDQKEYDLFLPTTTVGSGKWANIRLRESSVNPVHARIKKVDGKFVIYDMLSRTGTYVNDKKLLRPRALRDGDEIKFGRVCFRFSGRNA